MSLELVDSNIVIVARQFNPTVVNQLWLVRRGLIGAEDFREGCIFTDELAQVNTDEFRLLVVPPRAQFSVSVDRDRQQELIIEKMGGLVHALPETPYRAVGINLTWQLIPDNEDTTTLCRRLSFVPESPIHAIFDAENARFGSYCSKDSLGCRLRLEMRPARPETVVGEDQEFLLLKFNYHLDISPEADALPIINNILIRWNDALDETSQIAHAAEEH